MERIILGERRLQKPSKASFFLNIPGSYVRTKRLEKGDRFLISIDTQGRFIAELIERNEIDLSK